VERSIRRRFFLRNEIFFCGVCMLQCVLCLLSDRRTCSTTYYIVVGNKSAKG
jgi:hypothetical protein